MHKAYPPLPNKKYEIMYADPPWDYKGQRQHNGKGGRETGGAIAHYPTVTSDEMKSWEIPSIAADHCLLFMWATSPHLDQAIDLGKAWGFAWATAGFVWHKQKTNPGFYTMSQCELCLIFKKGKIPHPRGSRSVRQFLSVKRTKHSEKPDEVRERIEQMFPSQRKIELFARRKVSGWDVWGWDVSLEVYSHAQPILLHAPERISAVVRERHSIDQIHKSIKRSQSYVSPRTSPER